jgi:hypothetical protein
MQQQPSTTPEKPPEPPVPSVRGDQPPSLAPEGVPSTPERESDKEKGPCQVSDQDGKRAQDFKDRAKRWRERAAEARQWAREATDPKRAQQWEDAAKSYDGSARLNEAEAARILCEPLPATAASGPTPSETPVSPPSTPPETPAVAVPAGSAGICGPDVTHNVLAVLKAMYDEFKQAAPAKQQTACDALVDTATGSYAWDIIDLFMGSGTFPKGANDSGEPSTFEVMTNGTCCKPRWPCGPTVEFFGACHNQQVVNYVMWGLTRSVCSFWVNVQQSLALPAYTHNSPNQPEQYLMAAVGEKFGDILKVNDSPNLTHGFPLSDSAITNPDIHPELKRLVDAAEGASTRPSKQCAAICDKTLDSVQLDAIKRKAFTFRWDGLN